MKISLSIAVFVFLSSGLLSQMPDFNWVKPFGGTQDQNGNSIVRDNAGNYYSAGRFTGVVDFDPGPGLYQAASVGGNSDGYILKQDPQGNLLWVKLISGNGQETCHRIELDQNGDVYVVGDYTGSVDLNPGTAVESVVTAGFYDAFILKLTPSGNYIWSKHIGSTGQDSFFELEFDQQNNIIVGGVYTGNVDVDPGPATVMHQGGANNNGIILKLTSAGDFMFARSFDSNFLSTIDNIQINNTNEIIVQGVFSDSCDLDPGITDYIVSGPGSAHSLFACKWTSSGDFVWGVSVPLSLSGALVWHPHMNIDGNSNLIISGQFVGTCDFDPGTGVHNLTATAANGFILKLDTDGNFNWVKNLVGTSQLVASNVQVDTDENIYITGFIQGQFDFDPGSGTHYAGNAQNVNPYYGYVAKYMSSGGLIWVYSALDLYPTELMVYNDKIAVTGSFKTSVDFDPSPGSYLLNSLGGNDIFVCEWTSNCFNRVAEVVTSCSDYTWSKNNQVYTSSGTYAYTVENVNGCDSIFTLELTIPAITISMDFDTVLCDTSAAFILDVATPAGGIYEINGQEYASLDPGNLVTGAYTMVYTVLEDGCPFSDTTQFSVVHCSGLSVNSNESIDFSYYPNPAKDHLFYTSETPVDSIQVFDNQGKLLHVPVNTEMINLSELANGLYTVVVNYSGSQKSFKVMLDK